MRVSLATKFTAIILGILLVSVADSILGLVAAFHANRIGRRLVDEYLPNVRDAEGLEDKLLEQRGFVSSYLLDNGNSKWVQDLDQMNEKLRRNLADEPRIVKDDNERQLLENLRQTYDTYDADRQNVIDLFKKGEHDQARKLLLEDVNGRYADVRECCKRLIDASLQRFSDAREEISRQADNEIIAFFLCDAVTLVMGVVLLWLFFHSLLLPLRRMAADARGFASSAPVPAPGGSGDDLGTIGHYLRTLMSDVAEARSDLERSREQLAHAEKLAAVGKLAASVAHEIRNPLTAIKMWMFSLRRAVSGDTELEGKFHLISDEISRLENIIRSFLEFSRPPKLKITRLQLNNLLERTAGLFEIRLLAERTHIEFELPRDLPDVLGDPEQLTQVMINLVTNAQEAMPHGGTIRITAERAKRAGRPMVAVRITDAGVGVSPEIQARIFEPFITTKTDGVGLGLCIAASIMARHEGALVLERTSPGGTAFVVWIPAFEELLDG